MRAAVYEVLQIFFWLCAVPFYLIGFVLRTLHPNSIQRMIMTGPYYWAVVRKRRARGEEEWQEHDFVLGISPPKDHSYWRNRNIPQLLKNEDKEA